MALTPMVFNPVTGLLDTTAYITGPASETDARTQVQGRFNELRDYLNNTLLAAIAAVTDGASGADNTGMTAITETGAAATVQSIMEALITRLKAVTNSASGADLLGMTVITETGANATVQSVIEALITRIKAVADGVSGADLTGATAITGLTGATVQALLEALKDAIDDVDPTPADNSITNTKLATDAKVGSLAALSTTEKTNLVGALNELFTSASNGKTGVAAAVTGMGQAASGADSFATLATKIGDISDDADAGVGDTLASKTFYQGGAKRTGTMVDRGTVSTDITTKAQQVTIAAGKHSGSGTVQISAAEQAKVIAGNIKSGVIILDITGNYVTPVTISASDLVQYVRATTVSGSTTIFTKKAEYQIKHSGTIRVSFYLWEQAPGSSYIGRARVYKNDVAVGTERVMTGAPTGPGTLFSEDFNVDIDDLIQIYTARDTAGYNAVVSSISLLFDVSTGVNYIQNL